MPAGETKPTLTRVEGVFILDLGNADNAINAGWCDAVEAALQLAEDAPAPRALVTIAQGDSWSHGLDHEWLRSSLGRAERFVARLHELYACFLGSSLPTVAAVQGGAVAAGALFAFAHDQIVLGENRGYICFRGIEDHLSPAGGVALLETRLTPVAAAEAATTGRRFDAKEALAAGVVDEVTSEDRLVPAALARAVDIAASDPVALRASKRRLNAEAIAINLRP